MNHCFRFSSQVIDNTKDILLYTKTIILGSAISEKYK